jgi:hypothetical protein
VHLGEAVQVQVVYVSEECVCAREDVGRGADI